MAFIFSCKITNTNFTKKIVEGTAIICYERDVKSNDNLYYLKSQKCLIGKKELDLIDWIAPNSKLDLMLNKYIDYTDMPFSICAFYSKSSNEKVYYSPYIYNWFSDKDEISIIFNFKGTVLQINKVPNDRKYGIYSNYSCPITLDTLNIPFYKIIKIDSCYFAPNNWLKDNNYYKASVDSFNVNFCD